MQYTQKNIKRFKPVALSLHFAHFRYHQVKVQETQRDASEQACELEDRLFLWAMRAAITPNIRWELLFVYRENKGHTGSLLFHMERLHRKRKLPTSRAQCISRTDIHTVSPNCFVMRLNTRIKRLNWSVDTGDKTVEPQPHFTTSIGL